MRITGLQHLNLRRNPKESMKEERMRFFRNTHGWPSLLAVLALCALLELTYGCSKFTKKAEFEPGNEWVEDMRARVEENIEDPGKKTRMLALVDQIEKDLLEVDRVVRKLYTDLDILGDNYDSTPEEFQKVISKFEDDREKVVARIVDSRFKMRDLSTPETWEKLTDTSKRNGLYKQTIRQPGQ
jgi:hypothetical protein